jgi:hypothetical protein
VTAMEDSFVGDVFHCNHDWGCGIRQAGRSVAGSASGSAADMWME